jgi:hypothetical protein
VHGQGKPARGATYGLDRLATARARAAPAARRELEAQLALKAGATRDRRILDACRPGAARP